VLLLVVTEIRPVQLPRGGFMTVSSALDYAAIALFGPVAAAWIDVGSGVLVHGLLRPRPPARVLDNLATYILAAFAGAAAFRALGGVQMVSLAPRPVTFAGLARCPWSTPTRQPRTRRRSATHPGASGGQLRMDLPSPTFLPIRRWSRWRTARGASALVLFLLPLSLSARAFKLYLEMRDGLIDFSTALVGVIEEASTRRHPVGRHYERLARPGGARKRRRSAHRPLRCLGKIGQTGTSCRSRAPRCASSGMQAPPGGGRGVGGHPSPRGCARLVRHATSVGAAAARGRLDPLGSRIVLVADAFDAMTSDRPYRPGLTVERALAELRRHAGSQFDARVVDTLFRLRERGEFEIIRHEVGDRDIRQVG
jgi:hypothetical protein